MHVNTSSSLLIGRSAVFLRAVALIERMARFDAPVLIVGETGTGKELAARAIHYQSARARAPFVPLNCGALPEMLIESELFGCERGAFTDARQQRSGLIAAAQGGTLFLDEVDALAPRAQVALLRFLQDHHYRPVGGTREQHGDVRIIAAASPRLGGLLQSQAFRDDLAFRLNVLRLELPPLRERLGDALRLAEHFVARHAREHRLPPRPVAAASHHWLDHYAWPGNVRELDNLVQRSLLLSDGDELLLGPTSFAVATAPATTLATPPATTPQAARWAGMVVPHGLDGPDMLGDSTGHGAGLGAFNDARQQALCVFERDYLLALMRMAGGNVTRAAQLAGKERRALGRLLKKHGLGHAPLQPLQPPPTADLHEPLRHALLHQLGAPGG